jgi:ribosomal protein S18 acetylase RimI-like enzyme
MIISKNLYELSIKEKKDINNLILRNFNKSRLDTYETIFYFINENSIIGHIGVYYLKNYLCLNQLCVDSNYRNQGIATKLLLTIDNHFKNISQILYIDKNKSNTFFLFDFYIKKGFKEMDYLETFNLTYNKEKEYIMIKK